MENIKKTIECIRFIIVDFLLYLAFLISPVDERYENFFKFINEHIDFHKNKVEKM